MTWELLGPLLVTAAVTIAGWLVAHRLSAWRDRVNRRRDERLHHLVAAYQTLAQIRGHDEAWKLGDKIRLAIADVQFFGTEEQIKHAIAWIEAAKAKENIAIDELDVLVESLRADLCDELGMKAVDTAIWWVWIGPPNQPTEQGLPADAQGTRAAEDRR